MQSREALDHALAHYSKRFADGFDKNEKCVLMCFVKGWMFHSSLNLSVLWRCVCGVSVVMETEALNALHTQLENESVQILRQMAVGDDAQRMQWEAQLRAKLQSSLGTFALGFGL